MNYELVCIFSPKVIGEDLEKGIDKIKDLLKELKAKEIESNNWGKKTLAYEIDKITDGYYIQYNFIIEPSYLGKLDKKLKLEDEIIRFLVIKQEKFSEAEDLSKDEDKESGLEKNKELSDKKPKGRNIKSKDFDKTLEEVLDKDITD